MKTLSKLWAHENPFQTNPVQTKAVLLTIAIVIVIMLASNARAEAASYNCGRYMRSVFGIADKSYNLALKWAGLTRTHARPGAVVVQTRKGKASDGKTRGGHVSKIIALRSNCRALVRDNRGTYERDICRRLVAYVQP